MVPPTLLAKAKARIRSMAVASDGASAHSTSGPVARNRNLPSGPFTKYSSPSYISSSLVQSPDHIEWQLFTLKAGCPGVTVTTVLLGDPTKMNIGVGRGMIHGDGPFPPIIQHRREEVVLVGHRGEKGGPSVTPIDTDARHPLEFYLETEVPQVQGVGDSPLGLDPTTEF